MDANEKNNVLVLNDTSADETVETEELAEAIESAKAPDVPEVSEIPEEPKAPGTPDKAEVTHTSAPKSPIDTIYEEREEFIIIGLTGRTGSGCSTVSNILSTENFDDLDLHDPQSTNFENNEQRKYQIIFKYAEKHWNPFKVISMTNVIVSYLVSVDYDTFKNIIIEVFPEDGDISKTVISDLNDLTLTEEDMQDLGIDSTKLNDSSFKSLYQFAHDEMNKLLTDGKLKRPPHKSDGPDKDNIAQRECDILKYLGAIKKQLNNILVKHAYEHEVQEEKRKEGEKPRKETANAYTYFLQEIGNRIRHHGTVENSSNFSGEHMYALAKRANGFIKAYKAVSQKTLICLDAIRNPYEATYFQDRYASFYLVSVSTDNEERIRRLGNNMDYQEVDAMDRAEYPKKLKGEKQFTNQNIGACAQLTDIYLYNPREDTKEKYFISELIVKYITLIKHPGLVSPTSVERCMQIAYNAKLNSGCLSRQVGAVVTDKHYSVKAVGWNSVAEGQVPCNLRSIDNYLNNKDPDSFSTYEIENPVFSKLLSDNYSSLFKKSSSPDSFKGRLFSYCFKDEYEKLTKEKNQVHTRSLHAEENAFLQLAKYGSEGIIGGNLFTSASCCVLCSKKAYQLGIRNIYYIDPYTDIANSHILSFGKDKSQGPQCHLFYGAIGRAYTCLFTQRIAIKDELKILLDAQNAKND